MCLRRDALSNDNLEAVAALLGLQLGAAKGALQHAKRGAQIQVA